MTLISFISIPVTTLDGETKTIKIDLNNNYFGKINTPKIDMFNNTINELIEIINNNTIISDIDLKRWNDILKIDDSRTSSCDTMNSAMISNN
jgi:hypothetical protein